MHYGERVQPCMEVDENQQEATAELRTKLKACPTNCLNFGEFIFWRNKRLQCLEFQKAHPHGHNRRDALAKEWDQLDQLTKLVKLR